MIGGSVATRTLDRGGEGRPSRTRGVAVALLAAMLFLAACAGGDGESGASDTGRAQSTASTSTTPPETTNRSGGTAGSPQKTTAPEPPSTVPPDQMVRLVPGPSDLLLPLLPWVSAIGVSPPELNGPITAFSNDGSELSVTGGDWTYVLDLESEEAVLAESLGLGQVDPSGSLVAGGIPDLGTDAQEVLILELETGRVIGGGMARPDLGAPLHFGSDWILGAPLFDESIGDGEVVAIDMNSVIGEVPGVAEGRVALLGVSDDGLRFAFVTKGPTPEVTVVDRAGQVVWQGSVTPQTSGSQNAGAFDAQGSRLVLAGDGGATVVDVETGEEQFVPWDCGGTAMFVRDAPSIDFVGNRVAAVLGPQSLVAPVTYEVVVADLDTGTCEVVAARTVQEDFGYGNVTMNTAKDGDVLGVVTFSEGSWVSFVLDLAARPPGEVFDFSDLP
ncbi:MAG TPA: hypothetical protein ENI86_13635 [Acidimicrobiales bacterium]|nr:hypothetical protein [Acidimicrobiales bacterium]